MTSKLEIEQRLGHTGEIVVYPSAVSRCTLCYTAKPASPSPASPGGPENLDRMRQASGERDEDWFPFEDVEGAA